MTINKKKVDYKKEVEDQTLLKQMVPEDK